MGAFFVSTVLLAAEIVVELEGRSALWVPLGLLVGFVAADFVSGLIHWFGDTWGTPEWPILGQSVIRPFREHHEDQLAITRHDFIETNGASSMGSLVLLALAWAMPEGRTGFFVELVLVSLSLWLLATNQIHKWAHAPCRPALVGWLQRRRGILSPDHHRVHHSPPFDRWYCITTGWLNPLLWRIDFFATLERWITRATGAVPRAYDSR